jgi:hypothetical protein
MHVIAFLAQATNVLGSQATTVAASSKAQWFSAAAALAAVVVALFLALMGKRLHERAFRIRVEMDVPERQNNFWDKTGTVFCHHLRVSVQCSFFGVRRCSSHRPVVNCRVWLARIYEAGPDGWVERQTFAARRHMRWAPYEYSPNERTFTIRDVFDLGTTLASGGFELSLEQGGDFPKLWKPGSKLLAVFVVTADNYLENEEFGFEIDVPMPGQDPGTKQPARVSFVPKKSWLKCTSDEQGKPSNPRAGGGASASVTKVSPASCSQNERHERRYGFKDYVEIVGILGGLIGVYMLVAQYREMVKATKATFDAVEVSKGQMATMQRQLDDAEAQQRAWLRIEDFRVRRATVSKILPKQPGKYSVEIAMILRNFGSTPAIDLRGSGFTLSESAERFDKTHGFTNDLKRWSGGTPIPTPGNGGIGIMPQETFTNEYEMGTFDVGDNFYIESWISYRDIFGHPWIIGEGGTYHFTNDSLTTDFLNWGQFRDQNQTNK